jgi:hypothetical protein
MGASTLDLDNNYEADRNLGKGHGANALGPSNSSDSGSDVAGILGTDNDTDADGTGERATVDMMDSAFNRQETGIDRIESIESDNAEYDDEEDDEGATVDQNSKRI